MYPRHQLVLCVLDGELSCAFLFLLDNLLDRNRWLEAPTSLSAHSTRRSKIQSLSTNEYDEMSVMGTRGGKGKMCGCAVEHDLHGVSAYFLITSKNKLEQTMKNKLLTR